MTETTNSEPRAEGFSNLVTSVLAETLSSYKEVWGLLRKAGALPSSGTASESDFRSAVEPFVRSRRSALLDAEFNLQDVRWGEVAACFSAESDPYGPPPNAESLPAERMRI